MIVVDRKRPHRSPSLDAQRSRCHHHVPSPPGAAELTPDRSTRHASRPADLALPTPFDTRGPVRMLREFDDRRLSPYTGWTRESLGGTRRPPAAVRPPLRLGAHARISFPGAARRLRSGRRRARRLRAHVPGRRVPGGGRERARPAGPDGVVRRGPGRGHRPALARALGAAGRARPGQGRGRVDRPGPPPDPAVAVGPARPRACRSGWSTTSRRRSAPHYPPINWIWFQIVVEQFLASVGGPFAREDIEAGLALTDGFARENGWYADGAERAYDHYVRMGAALLPADLDRDGRRRPGGRLAAAGLPGAGWSATCTTPSTWSAPTARPSSRAAA